MASSLTAPSAQSPSHSSWVPAWSSKAGKMGWWAAAKARRPHWRSHPAWATGIKVGHTAPPKKGLRQKSVVSFSGAGDTIPPNADLIFDVELVDIDRVYHQEVLTPKSCTKKQQSRDQDIVNFNYVGKLANGNRENTFKDVFWTWLS